MVQTTSATVPYRWDLVMPDQLGTLLDGTPKPGVAWMPELVECTARVLARSGNGDLVFVGRSLDTMFDLLSGALADLRKAPRIARLPLSFARENEQVSRYRWRPRGLTPSELATARNMVSDLGLSPHALARRSRPVTFVDVVDGGGTFSELFGLVFDWVAEEGAPWPTIRRKLRFVGVTIQTKTSPKTFRWQQHAPWTSRLPARAVVNVSLHRYVWSYFGNNQVKLTRTFRPESWVAGGEGPARDEATRKALAEAVAVVEYGRSGECRRALARAMQDEPALRAPWLRALQRQLNQG